MSLLAEYEQQYSNLTAEITAKLGRISGVPKGERKSYLGNLQRQLTDVDELLEQMEIAVRELPPETDKLKYSNRLKSYRADKDHLQTELKNVGQRYVDVDLRDDLFGYEGTSDDQRQMLLDNTERLDRSSRKLEQGYKIAVETEQIGADILSNLDTQRQTLTRARDRLRDTEFDLGQSSHVLSRMIRRVIQNRFLLLLIAGVILVVIIVAIYLTASRKH